MPFAKTIKYTEVVNIDNDKITSRPENVEQGKTFVGRTKKIEIGAMPVYEEHGDITLLAGESQQFNIGKVSKPFKVIATPLAEQTVADAESSDIISGKFAWVNGSKIRGNIPTFSDKTINLSSGQQESLADGYYKNCKVTGSVLAQETTGTAIDSDILSGKTAWVNGEQITGSMSKSIPINIKIGPGEAYNLDPAYYPGGKITSETINEATPGNAIGDDILLGKTAWVNGNKITGTIQNVTPTQYTLPINGTYTIPRGYHTGLGSVIQHVETMDGLNITPSTESRRIPTAGKYMTQDITVAPVTNAVSFEIPENKYIIDQNIVFGEDERMVITLPVDNWHDNNTMNVYNIDIIIENDDTSTSPPSTKLVSLIKGNIVLDGRNNSKFNDLILSDMLKVYGMIDSITKAHTFIILLNPDGGVSDNFVAAHMYIKIKEVFRCRNYVNG